MKKVNDKGKCAWIQCNEVATANGYCSSHYQKMYYFDDKNEENEEIRRLKGESGVYLLVFKGRIYVGKAQAQQFAKRNYDERNALITGNYANLKSKRFHELFNEYGRKECGEEWDNTDKKKRHEARGKYFDDNVEIRYINIDFFLDSNHQPLSFKQHRKHLMVLQMKKYDNDRNKIEKRVYMSEPTKKASKMIENHITIQERKRIQYLYDFDKEHGTNILLNENLDGIVL